MKNIQKRQSLSRFIKFNRRVSLKLATIFGMLIVGALVVMSQMQSDVAAAGRKANISTVNNGTGVFVANVAPTGTFLHAVISEDQNTSDDPAHPTIVDLSLAGFQPGDELKLTYQVNQPFCFNTNASPIQYAEPIILAVFSSSSVLLPAQSLRRVPDAIKAGDEVRTGPAGPVDQSEPDDLAEDFQILPATGTTIRIPDGATHLFLGVADSFYKDNAGELSITIERARFFDVCLQDDATGDTLLFNSNTGDYRFIHCGPEGFVVNQNGVRHTVSRKNSQVTLNDFYVSAVLDTLINRGSATIRVPDYAVAFTLRDSNTRDNTCTCR